MGSIVLHIFAGAVICAAIFVIVPDIDPLKAIIAATAIGIAIRAEHAAIDD